MKIPVNITAINLATINIQIKIQIKIDMFSIHVVCPEIAATQAAAMAVLVFVYFSKLNRTEMRPKNSIKFQESNGEPGQVSGIQDWCPFVSFCKSRDSNQVQGFYAKSGKKTIKRVIHEPMSAKSFIELLSKNSKMQNLTSIAEISTCLYPS